MKVAVLGNTGMLGHVVENLCKQEFDEVLGRGRESLEVHPRTLNDLGTKLSMLFGHDTDYVVNCIGAIKPTFAAASDLSIPIYTNAVFPHQLATWGELTDTKVIHITTDCVYSGGRGKYIEVDPHDALDEYGKSKSLGEATNAMVIRTSIIGPEFGGRKRSFVEWLKGQSGKTINGFTNHYWNGLTTIELTNALMEIMSADVWRRGLYHVFSEDITKYDMVKTINDIYDLNVNINEFETDSCVDRTLRTIKDLNEFLQPPCFSNMIDDMRRFEAA